MPTLKLTTKFCESVAVECRTEFIDTMRRGLILRVSPQGRKDWSFRYVRSSDGRRQRLKIGSFPAVGLEVARKRALEHEASIASGADPASEAQQLKRADTVRELAGAYIEEYARPKKRTWTEDLRILNADVLPYIGNHKITALTRRDVRAVVERKSAAKKPAQARQVLAVTRKMLNWAVATDQLIASPAQGLTLPPEEERDRVLADHEISNFWRNLQTAPLHPTMVAILKILLLTAQRVGEVVAMDWSEIDLDLQEWKLGKTRTKNKREHVVPIGAEALQILKTTSPELTGPVFSVFDMPVQGNSVAQAVRRSLQLPNGERWTPHDLRRTAATGMANIGVAPHIVEAILNHQSGFRSGIAGIYNRAAYLPEKRAALEAWSQHIANITRE